MAPVGSAAKCSEVLKAENVPLKEIIRKIGEAALLPEIQSCDVVKDGRRGCPHVLALGQDGFDVEDFKAQISKATWAALFQLLR